MAIPLAELIKAVPPDTEKRVDKAKGGLNRRIRDLLRQATGLQLNRPTTDDQRRAPRTDDLIDVPTRCEPRLPISIKDLVLDDGQRLALVVGKWRATLKSLHASAGGSLQVLDDVRGRGLWRATFEGRGPELLSLRDWAAGLLREIDESDPIKSILHASQDVLGTYTFTIADQTRLFPVAPSGRVTLYWAVIGLVADLLGSSVEALTGAVLAHELAHAFCHLGTDIDGRRWDSRAFAACGAEIQEALAQYYTHLVCQRLDGVEPETAGAYREPLKHQSDVHRHHEQWIDAYSPEAVRFALLEARRPGRVTLAELEEWMARAQARLWGEDQG